MSHRYDPFQRTYPVFRGTGGKPLWQSIDFGGMFSFTRTRYGVIGLAAFVAVLAHLISPAAFGFSKAAAQDVNSFRPVSPVPGGQEAPMLLRELLDAFESGDARGVVRCSSRRLDVTIFGVSELFSQSQVGYVLRDFFADYPPRQLEVTEMSGSIDNWFAAGRFWYEKGEAPLSVYFRLRFSGGEWKLREVRIGRTIQR